MSQPKIVLVPGSFGSREAYKPLLEASAMKNLELPYLPLPSIVQGGVVPTTPPPSMYDDARFIADEVEKICDAGHHVIILAHSYGGIPASESLKYGIGKRERQSQGKRGGVVRLAYIASPMPAVGSNIVTSLAGNPPENKLDMATDVSSKPLASIMYGVFSCSGVRDI